MDVSRPQRDRTRFKRMDLFLPVQTVPILDVLSLRDSLRECAAGRKLRLCGDRCGLVQSLPLWREKPAEGGWVAARNPAGRGLLKAIASCAILRPATARET